MVNELLNSKNKYLDNQLVNESRKNNYWARTDSKVEPSKSSCNLTIHNIREGPWPAPVLNSNSAKINDG